MPDIECRTAESMVTKYINHSLSVDELEEFLDHISHCSSCYDELETYLLCMKQYSSWMSRKMVLYLIFVNFWIRISENHADISVRNGGFIS